MRVYWSFIFETIFISQRRWGNIWKEKFKQRNLSFSTFYINESCIQSNNWFRQRIKFFENYFHRCASKEKYTHIKYFAVDYLQSWLYSHFFPKISHEWLNFAFPNVSSNIHTNEIFTKVADSCQSKINSANYRLSSKIKTFLTSVTVKSFWKSFITTKIILSSNHILTSFV